MTAKQKIPQVSPTERVQNTFAQLYKASEDLNIASQELGGAILVLDDALQKLNLGVAAWLAISAGEDPPSWWSRDVGYAKIGKKWGLALRKRSGDYNDPDHDEIQEWPFNEGPRWMRAEAVMKIPDLLEKILERVGATTKKIKDKTKFAYELGEAVNQMLEAAQPEQKAKN
jgi:hypothetical protein